LEHFTTRTSPTLGGEELPLEQFERSRSLVVHPQGDRFVLGTNWSLRAFDAQGAQLWPRAAPDVVWAVNISGDSTIRWHRMTDGVELLAFMPLANQTDWVAWTPEGFYAATAGAQGVLRWYVNRGWDAAADSVPIADKVLLPFVLQELETTRALGRADMVEHSKQVMLRTNSHVPPGARLHLLAIGISAYN